MTRTLVLGLQRVSTLLEFMGELLDSNGKSVSPSVLEGTRGLPSLAGRTWVGKSGLTPAQKLDVKRARMRVEILKRESDPTEREVRAQDLSPTWSQRASQMHRPTTRYRFPD